MMRTYAAAVALATALTACNGDDPKPRASESVPMIATDPCPEPSAPRQGGGDRLPDVELTCLGRDSRVNMRALGGTPYVVNLWASWCLPCRTEMPEFQKVYTGLKGRVGFLGVDTKDFERPARESIQRAAVSYPSVFDPDERIKRAVNTRSLPATVFLNADGSIASVHVGQLTEAELRAEIAKHLGVS
ncbi:MAG TPA: TlpA disulfide reductase family protein [Frankiaceae bacterium]|jgi:thiol-disulfide isomerase/thioredoxin|nr:TlpA disulfide reductase family protein [Frankiaceae bacterium]